LQFKTSIKSIAQDSVKFDRYIGHFIINLTDIWGTFSMSRFVFHYKF